MYEFTASGREAIKRAGPWATLRAVGGYYACPFSPINAKVKGRRLGPLVGYAGTYPDTETGQPKHYVGDVYCNFSAAEQYPVLLHTWARELKPRIIAPLRPTVCLGAPLGGILLAEALAFQMGIRVAFAEKKVIWVASDSEPEESVLEISRHTLLRGDRVLIVEDVCNNMKTTAELVRLIRLAGAIPAGIACFLNRSPGLTFTAKKTELAIISVVRKQFAQYRQDDPEVAADVQAGKVVWKPKKQWARLAAVQRKHLRQF